MNQQRSQSFACHLVLLLCRIMKMICLCLLLVMLMTTRPRLIRQQHLILLQSPQSSFPRFGTLRMIKHLGLSSRILIYFVKVPTMTCLGNLVRMIGCCGTEGLKVNSLLTHSLSPRKANLLVGIPVPRYLSVIKALSLSILWLQSQCSLMLFMHSAKK